MAFERPAILRWVKGFPKVVPWIPYWIFILATSMMFHPIALLIDKFYLWAIPFLSLGCISFLMYKCGEKYQGMTKSMGLPHLIIVTLLMLYILFNFTFNTKIKITFNDYPLSFVSGWYFIGVHIISNGFDIFDIYLWYIKKTRSVIRDDKTLDRLKQEGKLAKDVGYLQDVMVNGQIIGDTDEYGFLKPDPAFV